MKLLTVAIPCYNSQEYLHRAVESALTGGESVEVLIIDDGSTDDTAHIADAYALSHPSIVRTIHQPNRGHGGAVMTGLAEASGLYFKVLDSDDWLDSDVLLNVLRLLSGLTERDHCVDMFIANYVYEKADAKHKHVVRYTNALPVDQPFGWEKIGHLHYGQYFLMHSIIYRMQFLRECDMRLPEHTFYVDNLYAYIPLPMVKTMYYHDAVMYHYYIGREDQSVHECVMIKRINQQLQVNRLMFQHIDIAALQDMNVRRYMRKYLEIITAVSCVLLMRSRSQEHLMLKKKLWTDLKHDHPATYRMLRWRPIGICLHLPGWMGKAIVFSVYRITKIIFGYN